MDDRDVLLMTQKEMMRQLYTLQKESVENDARLQSQMDELNRRMYRQEKATLSGAGSDRDKFNAINDSLRNKS